MQFALTVLILSSDFLQKCVPCELIKRLHWFLQSVLLLTQKMNYSDRFSPVCFFVFVLNNTIGFFKVTLYKIKRGGCGLALQTEPKPGFNQNDGAAIHSHYKGQLMRSPYFNSSVKVLLVSKSCQCCVYEWSRARSIRNSSAVHINLHIKRTSFIWTGKSN